MSLMPLPTSQSLEHKTESQPYHQNVEATSAEYRDNRGDLEISSLTSVATVRAKKTTSPSVCFPCLSHTELRY